jgi:FAD/FMN-containing dehydrogenase
MTLELETLATKVPLSWPGQDRYAAAISVWPQQSGPAPAAVAHCRNAVDVQETVRAARTRGLPLSVRGGGHDWAGRALCTGLVIDLSPMRGATVERDKTVIRMGGGALARDVFEAADPVGRAAVTGAVGAVGMAGLTLGGGYGPLTCRFGLALDNLVSAEVVLADGGLVVADEKSNAELFWALRGGGGNFGVVTQMRHRLHPVPSVYSGMIVYPFERAEGVLSGCAEILSTAPDELSAQFILASDPAGKPAVLVAPCWSGAPADAEGRVAPLTRLDAPEVVMLKATPAGAANTLFDAYAVKGKRVFIETRWLRRLSEESISALVAAVRQRPSPGCAIATHEFRGAAARVPVETTAFGLRSDHTLVEIVAISDADRDGEPSPGAGADRNWAKQTSSALAPFSLPGGYPNLLTGEDPERVRASFGPNAERLAAAKRRFDPDSVWRALPLPLPRAG